MTASDCEIPHRAPPSPAALAVLRAEDAFRANIVDPRDDGAAFATSRSWIRTFIGDGLGWPSEAAAYNHDGQFAWCGAFVAWCWRDGVPLGVRRQYFASTYRLSRLARGGGLDKVPAQLVQVVKPHDVVPGDIITLWGDQDGYGTHIALVAEVGARLVTIEGNANGVGPRGDRREGVVRCERQLEDVRLALRVC